MEALPLVSGAFGVWKRSAVIAVGGFTTGHMGEDMDLTMRLHRYHIDNAIPYRIVYEPSAVIWTEVPETMRVLKRQRIRWHRGLMTAVKDFLPMTFNPKYGKVGMVTWAAMFLFEYLAPIIEVLGWITIPVAFYLGALNTTSLVILIALAFGVGLVNSLVALLLDEAYGYFNSKADTARLIVMVLIENFGMRQITVAWRIRAIIGGKATRAWGNMERKGVANLGGPPSGDKSRTSASAARM
jgi:cellulose synthase/poly-beta-1,6-N-acetylglucosamine synthase-like glycosyltransferase